MILLYTVPGKYLASVNNQVPKSCSCCQKFSDDDSDQTQADIDLHNTQDIFQAGRDDHQPETVHPVSAKCLDQLQFIRFNGNEPGVDVQDTAEDRHGDGTYNNCFIVSTQPDDQDRSQSGFRKAV